MAYDVLIVDDEADIRGLTADILGDEGYETRQAADSASALDLLAARRPNLVLLDIWLQGSDLDGLGILKEIKQNHPEIPVLMMSGHGTVETAVTAIKDGAYDFIEKPFRSDRLLLLVERAIEAARLKRDNAELRVRVGTADGLTGQSPEIRDLCQLVERVAATNSRVLISGPSGSGKEVVARMIHTHSPRSDAAFVVMNCAMMEPDRMETELFGTEGSGAADRRIGTFEQAHGGTLLLDEISDMPLETQGKIVRVLQEQTFTRVGGNIPVSVDVRVMATATRPLQVEIDMGRFREDLYYRLNVVPISVPPLVERRLDIGALADHFLARAAEAAGRPKRHLGEDTLAALQRYPWPGNVRELRNVVERMLILDLDEPLAPLGPGSLPPEIMEPDRQASETGLALNLMGLPLREAREQFERDYLSSQVERFEGNISKTAQFVGMERAALHRKLKSLGLTGNGK